MKKCFLLVILFLCYISISAQTEGSLLLGLTPLTTTEMNNVSAPIDGSLVYNTQEKWVYQYNGSYWEKLVSTQSPTVTQITTNYTVQPQDNGSVLAINSTTDLNLTMPTGLPVSFNISIYQVGNGTVTVLGAGGVTLKNRLLRFKTAGKDSGAGIISTSTNTFHITGDLRR